MLSIYSETSEGTKTFSENLNKGNFEQTLLEEHLLITLREP